MSERIALLEKQSKEASDRFEAELKGEKTRELLNLASHFDTYRLLAQSMNRT